jgi:hypothetical protein
MYWSVHQYQRPTIGAQNSIPTHGKSPLKYQAIRPGSITGAQVPSIPVGTRGFQRLNMSEGRAARKALQPPSLARPNTVNTAEPTTRIPVCTASVYATARIPPMTV